MDKKDVTSACGGRTYHREADNVIGKEIVVQTGKPVSSTGKKLDFGLDLQNKGVSRCDSRQHPFDALLELLQVLALELADDFLGAVDGDGRGDVVESRRPVESFSPRGGQKPRVDLLKRHLGWCRKTRG